MGGWRRVWQGHADKRTGGCAGGRTVGGGAGRRTGGRVDKQTDGRRDDTNWSKTMTIIITKI